MLGRANGQTMASGTGTINAAVAAQTAGTSAQMRTQYSLAGSAGSDGATPWVLIGFLLVYLAWALVIQHQRIKEQLAPSNVAANFHNFIVIGVSAVLGIVVLKVATTKMAAWGIPGFAAIAKFVAAA